MTFKENLLKKIWIDSTVKRIIGSMGSIESGKRTDTAAVRELLDVSGFTHQKVRDLDLYLQEIDKEAFYIIVLGNDLPMYKTTINDVALRRSPTVKEMISIRNAMRILNDRDILVTKGPETVEVLRKACVERLDLSYDESDIESIAADGMASLENAYYDGVMESLLLIGELLGFVSAPKKIKVQHFHMIGLAESKAETVMQFGPIVLFDKINNRLKLIDERIPLADNHRIEWIHQVANGLESASVEGPEVFKVLKKKILRYGYSKES